MSTLPAAPSGTGVDVGDAVMDVDTPAEQLLQPSASSPAPETESPPPPLQPSPDREVRPPAAAPGQHAQRQSGEGVTLLAGWGSSDGFWSWKLPRGLFGKILRHIDWFPLEQMIEMTRNK